MEKVKVNGKKVYARRDGKFLQLYDNLLDYILDIPSSDLATMYCEEHGTQTCFEILLRELYK